MDEIGCTSTNDASVMNEWQQDQGAEDNTLLPGGPNTLPALSGRGTWPQVYIGGKLIGNAEASEACFGVRKAA